AALAAVFVTVSWWAALSALLLAGLVAGRSRPKAGWMSAQGWNGGWQIQQADGTSALSLLHVWHGPAWTPLKFPTACIGKVLHLTVWRGEVSSSDWRHLRQLASRGSRQPRPSLEAQ